MTSHPEPEKPADAAWAEEKHHAFDPYESHSEIYINPRCRRCGLKRAEHFESTEKPADLTPEESREARIAAIHEAAHSLMACTQARGCWLSVRIREEVQRAQAEEAKRVWKAAINSACWQCEEGVRIVEHEGVGGRKYLAHCFHAEPCDEGADDSACQARTLRAIQARDEKERGR